MSYPLDEGEQRELKAIEAALVDVDPQSDPDFVKRKKELQQIALSAKRTADR